MKNQKYPYTDMYGREIRLLKEGIEHQGIGGQEFAIDEQVTQTLTNEEVFFQALNGNWACHNFVERRPDDQILIKILNINYIMEKLII